jgi:hypothetical protein
VSRSTVLTLVPLSGTFALRRYPEHTFEFDAWEFMQDGFGTDHRLVEHTRFRFLPLRTDASARSEA